MSLALFDLDDFEETRVEWVPLYKPHGLTLASLIVAERCRDCGAKVSWMNGGGGNQIGSFQVCEDCMEIDRCRDSETHPGRHSSHWGSYPHLAEDCEAKHAAREKRRGRYLARQRRVAS